MASSNNFTGLKFLGASVVNISSTLGWGGQAGSISVTLAEDDGESFDKPEPGTAVYLEAGALSFGGLVQSWTENHTQQGDTFSISVIDPRIILEDTQVILDQYEGSTLDIPNLINAYGAYEWGLAGVTEDGMPWNNIRPVLEAATLRFSNQSFTMNLSDVQAAPANFRLRGPHQSALDLIDTFCNEGGLEWYANLEGGNVIKIHTVPVHTQSLKVLDRIDRFVSLNSDIVHEWSKGQELRNDTTSAMVIGGDVQELLEVSDPVPFWGFNTTTSKPIVSFDYFDIDITELEIPSLNKIYTLSVYEVQAALGSYESWIQYLGMFKPNVYNALDMAGLMVSELQAILDDPTMFDKDIDDPVLRGTQQRVDEWKKQNPSLVNDRSDGDIWIDEFLIAGNSRDTPFRSRRVKQGRRLDQWNKRIAEGHRRLEQNASDELNNLGFDDVDEWKERLHDHIVSIGQNHYGKTFLIPLSNIDEYLDATTNQFKYTVDIVDSAWHENTTFGEGPIGLDPESSFNFQVKDGKFVAFVRFDTTTSIDVGRLNPDDYIISNNQLFLKCNIDTNIVRMGPDVSNVWNLNYNDQKAVIVTLPDYVPSIVEGVQYPPAIGMMNPFHDFIVAGLGGSENTKSSRAHKIIKDFLARELVYDAEGFVAAPFVLAPSIVAVPIKSHTNSYGPWTSHQQGSEGKVDLITNPDLVPWKYGGLNNMNNAGLDQVARAAANLKNSETGRVIVAGLPTRNIGQELLKNGPHITNISISSDLGGVQTTYVMNTYTPRFGDFGKDRHKQLQRAGQQQARTLDALRRSARLSSNELSSSYKLPNNKHEIGNLFGQPDSTAKFVKPNDFLMGHAGSNHVVTGNSRQILPYTNVENEYFTTIGGSSTNSIYRVCSTKVDDPHFPSFVRPTAIATATSPTVATLNPFASGNDMFIFSGSGLHPNDGFSSHYNEGHARPISLRAPLILSGWGRDTDGKPVPNADDNYPNSVSDEFLDGYTYKTESWKSGPLDSRWDEARGVWVAGGASLDLYVIVAHSGNMAGVGGDTTVGVSNGRALPRPRYVCRLVTGFDPQVNAQYPDPSVSGQHLFDLSTDVEAFNLQEGAGDIHLLGVGSTVVITTKFETSFFDAMPRSFIRRKDY